MFNQKCYLVSTQPGSWEKGKHDCQQRGADLVTIRSLEVQVWDVALTHHVQEEILSESFDIEYLHCIVFEQKFLDGVIKHSVWIGLNDRENEGTWKWSDGSPVNVT